MNKTRGTLALFVLIIFLFALGACQTPAGRSAGTVVDDSTITTKVKSELLADKRVSGLAISVDTFEGEVTLTGAVDTLEQKEAATEIAKNVAGVRDVKNLLKVQPKK